ncbi:dynamin family protein [Pseudomaricurvus sp.]|uniref:dynamin family protein n=1 Tax=Pseudomaricurvus sp. TaxID=2004510 RepID=UPI003F6AE7A8
MDATSFYQHMAEFARWKDIFSQQLRQSQQWFNDHQNQSQAARHCLQQALTLLDNSSFTVACVGEFSRGKTELINALLFTEYGQRLLPSKPGRTTMCPTEIFYTPGTPTDDHSGPGYVRLLPIETRRTTTSLNSFKRIPKNWVTLPFDVAHPESVERAMNAISQVKLVDASDARAMGFDPQQLSANQDGLLEVPRWRHALINLDHPLLRHGLRILDTPGLNALGNEPELTLGTLQQADAVIFLLAADSGLSYSDVTIWQDHLKGLRAAQGQHSSIALLNKVDALWDDLESADSVAQNIHDLREQTARMLSQPIENVVAISAKQGLLAQARRDQDLLQRSNLPQLEALLIQQLSHNQQQLAGQRILSDAARIVKSTRSNLKSQLFRADRELESLQQQLHRPAQFDAQVQSLRRDIRKQHQQYHRQQLDLRTYQRQIDQHCQQLRAPITSFQLEGLIGSTHQDMVKSWSFVGLSKAVDDFFQQLRQRMSRVEKETRTANTTLLSIYERAQNHSCSPEDASSHCFQLRNHMQRLRQLEHQAQQFRRSLGNIFNIKQRVIGRFINSLVQEVRAMNTDLNTAIDHWKQEALAPLSHETHYQKSLLDQQMLHITHLNQQQSSQTQRLQTLGTQITQQRESLAELERILDLQPCRPPQLLQDAPPPHRTRKSMTAQASAALVSTA